MRFSFWHDIRPGDTVSTCFDVSTSVPRAPIQLFPCHGMQGNQHFKYLLNSRQIFHPVSHQCLDLDLEKMEVFMSKCDEQAEAQKWKWQNLNETVIQHWAEEKTKK